MKTPKLPFAERFKSFFYEQPGATEPGTGTRKLPPISKPQGNFEMKVRKAIEANISNDNWRVPQLAEAVNLSREQVHRKLKALTGRSASEYIHLVRLEMAKKLLAHSNFSVSEIAYKVGYKTPAHFTRKFRDEFGVPPSALRAE